MTALVMDWVITALYVLAAWLCLRAGRSSGDAPHPALGRRLRIFWYAAAAVLLALGINKPLDLHVFVTRIGRQIARQGGWYDARLQVQAAFFLGVLCLAGGMLLSLVILLRRALRRNWLAVLGVVFLISFVVLRTMSLSHVDHVLGQRLVGIKMHRVLEVAGILCVGISAAWSARRRRTIIGPARRTSAGEESRS